MPMPRWEVEPPKGPLRPDEIHVWRVDLDDEDPAGTLLALISPDERDEAKRRRTSLDGRRFAIGRGSLRAILSRYLGGSGHVLRLTREPRGRIVLDPPAPISFSVAHAEAVGLVAIGRDRSIGVDLEPVSAASQIADVGDNYLPRNRVARIRAAPQREQDERWLRLWTEVEAFAKLDGRGLVDADSAAILLAAGGRSVQFRPTADHVATLVYGGQPARVAYLRFTPMAGEHVMRLGTAPGCR
jgi:4'-phosphopantetheinyl transferase